MKTFILAVMMMLAKAEPPSRHLPTYDSTAEAIALEAEANPLPLGEDSAKKTAALVAVWAWKESRFDQKARGDKGSSYCLMQISSSNFRDLGIKSGDELDDPRTCIRHALRMMATSFRICSSRPLPERAAWYAKGGAGCAGDFVLSLSRNRLARAKALYEQHRDEI